MKLIAPDYYTEFHCIASACRHTCCAHWEVDIDEDSLPRFLADSTIASHIERGETPHFRLTEDERCPFLTDAGLCELILRHGEDILCQICRDHPRFRLFWSDRTELGLGLVCEEAARLILTRETPMRLVVLSDDGREEALPEDEEWLLSLRSELIAAIAQTGPEARLLEYLLYRHLSDALYDDRVEERLAFIEASFREITGAWAQTDGSTDALVECARRWSYDVEYDEEEKEKRLAAEEDTGET